MNLIIAWIVSFMIAKSPPSSHASQHETVAEATARYDSIASDVSEVLYDPTEPPLFRGDHGRIQTSSVVMATMRYESGGFRKDVDTGVGKRSKGDGGASWCMMQVNLSPARKDGTTSTRIVLDPDGMFHYVYDGTGIGGEDLVRDRKTCIRVALHIMRKSFQMCSELPQNEKLSAYAAGNCGEDGRAPSRLRMNLAKSWYDNHLPTFTDTMVVIPVSTELVPPPVTALNLLGATGG